MKNRNKIYILIMAIILFLTSVFTFTYAYIGRANSSSSIINTNMTINGVLLTYSGSNAITLNLDYADLNVGNAKNDYSEFLNTSITGTVTLNVPSYYASGVTCQYRMVYTPLTTYVPSSAATSAGLKELELIFSSGVNTLKTLSLHNLSAKTTLYTTSISTNTGNTTSSQIYTTTLKFYNLNVDQSDALGQRPSGKIEIEVISCGGNS